MTQDQNEQNDSAENEHMTQDRNDQLIFLIKHSSAIIFGRIAYLIYFEVRFLYRFVD